MIAAKKTAKLARKATVERFPNPLANLSQVGCYVIGPETRMDQVCNIVEDSIGEDNQPRWAWIVGGAVYFYA